MCISLVILYIVIKLRMYKYKKSRKFASYGLEKPWLKQGLHYLFEILLSCCVAPYELSRNSTPFTGLTITYSSDLGYSFTMAIFYNLPQFLLRGLFSIYILLKTSSGKDPPPGYISELIDFHNR